MIYSIITGGSSGLGLEIANFLLQKNANIIIIGRHTGKIAESLNRLQEKNINARTITYPMDIANEEEVKNFIDFLDKNGMIIESLFNVAGSFLGGPIAKITGSDIKEVFESNLIGLIQMSAQCAVYMQKHSLAKHRIVSVLSTAALRGRKYETIYNAAKWGARGFLEGLKEELLETNIEVVTIYPGGMKTPFWNKVKSEEETSKYMNPADVAKHIVNISTDHNVLVSEIIINRS